VIETDPLARGRARVERRVEGLRIEIPAKRDWSVLAFLILFLVIWLAAGVAEIVEAARGEGELGGQLGPLIILSLGCLWAVWLLSVTFAGKEIATVTAGEFVLERVAWPHRREKRFRRDRIERLRTDAADRPERTFARMWNSQWEQFGLAGGSIVFDYGARTHRFGTKLDEAESRQLVELLAKELGLKLPAVEPARPLPF
jgi:hypothetical protein